MKTPPTGMKPEISRASARQPKPPPTTGSSSHIAERSGSRPYVAPMCSIRFIWIPVIANMSAPDANAPSTMPRIGTWSTTALAPATLSAFIAASRVSFAATVSRSAGRRRPTATSIPRQHVDQVRQEAPAQRFDRDAVDDVLLDAARTRRLRRSARGGHLGIDDEHEHRQPQRAELFELHRLAVGRPADADHGARVALVDRALRAERLERRRRFGRDRIAVVAGEQDGAQLAQQPGIAADEELEGPARARVHALGVERTAQALKGRDGRHSVHARLVPRAGEDVTRPRPARAGSYVRPRASLSGSSV